MINYIRQSRIFFLLFISLSLIFISITLTFSNNKTNKPVKKVDNIDYSNIYINFYYTKIQSKYDEHFGFFVEVNNLSKNSIYIPNIFSINNIKCKDNFTKKFIDINLPINTSGLETPLPNLMIIDSRKLGVITPEFIDKMSDSVKFDKKHKLYYNLKSELNLNLLESVFLGKHEIAWYFIETKKLPVNHTAYISLDTKQVKFFDSVNFKNCTYNYPKKFLNYILYDKLIKDTLIIK